MESKQTMASRPAAMKIHAALQLWHRIPKWIVYLIILIVPGAVLVAMLVAIGLRRAGARQIAGPANLSGDSGCSDGQRLDRPSRVFPFQSGARPVLADALSHRATLIATEQHEMDRTFAPITFKQSMG